ncbi:MAG: hypothetical protein L3J41_13555 [Melioribacteraceae bacterium]|nr:hypothetical protein [Melioribacteraceae bacterium]
MIINKIKLVLLFTATTFLFSCTLNNEPGKAENESSVIFNLTANKSVQELHLYRTADLEEEREPATYDSLVFRMESYAPFFIKDAYIQIESDSLNYHNFIVVKDEYGGFNNGFKYIDSDTISILPDTKYSLLIEYDGIKIRGETITPGNFTIISPKNNAVIKRTNDEKNVSFKIELSKSNNAKGYLITIVETDVAYDNSTSYIAEDTTFYLKTHMSWGNYRLEVMAYDKNFHNYIIEEYYQSGLENAYGYFGSSVLKSIDFKVKY